MVYPDTFYAFNWEDIEESGGTTTISRLFTQMAAQIAGLAFTARYGMVAS